MIEIYNKTNISRKKEKTFLDYLISENVGCKHIDLDKELNISLLNRTVNTVNLITKLRQNTTLTKLKRNRLIQELSKLPENIRVVKSISSISVDFVLVVGENIQYIEFHEKQHRNMSGKIPKDIYDENLEIIKVPRFVQRFLKDIWRYENLENYKIIWFDWFEQNKDYNNFLTENKKEYYLGGKFRFEKIDE
jgi:hypothetical protein